MKDNEAIEINPNYAEAYHNRGNAKYELKGYREAIQDYSKAIELEPKLAKAYNNWFFCTEGAIILFKVKKGISNN